MSDYLISQGRTGLDPRLSIIPVGGIRNVPAFITVMGRRLTVREPTTGARPTPTTCTCRSSRPLP
ncbi:hypothetical protein, partial [Streptomyces sp. NPDC059460]|uniref:hypothetical protein n=1 Tax=Streptomyces sp. NPDC059460 TaxID=3346840 RepID=UPI0036A9E87E